MKECKNCGAPGTTTKCKYCGTIYNDFVAAELAVAIWDTPLDYAIRDFGNKDKKTLDNNKT